MPTKWKLFGMANVLFLGAYLLLFVLAIGFVNEQLHEKKDIISFMPFMTSLLITIFNSAFNTYVSHKHLPDKPFSRRIRTAYFISAILFAISFIIISISIFRDINDEFGYRSTDNFFYAMLSIFSLNTLTGLFILFNQFVIAKFVENNYRRSLDKQIEDLGK
jgi:carbon starvation protein CstA